MAGIVTLFVLDTYLVVLQMSSMDLKTSPTAVLSTIVPLPVEIEQLCESAFSKLYCPYEKVRWTLLDQIRRIYYGDCNGDIQTLCHTFLAPAANLLDLIKRQSQVSGQALSMILIICLVS